MSGTPTEAGLSRPAAAFDWLGRFVFRFRDYLLPAGFFVALVLAPPRAPFGSARLDLVLDVIGVIVAAVGQTLRVAVIGYAYIERGGAGKKLSAPRLVCEGFYAHCRNPMYAGNFLLLTGLALIYNSLFVYALLLPVLVFGVYAIIKAEERFLAERFGAEYDAYCRQVPRFVPRLRGLGKTLEGMRFDWRRVLRKEYGTTFAWLSGAFALMAWERIVRLGWADSVPELRVLAALYLPIPVLWGTVRWLKKSHRLDSPEHITPP